MAGTCVTCTFALSALMTPSLPPNSLHIAPLAVADEAPVVMLKGEVPLPEVAHYPGTGGRHGGVGDGAVGKQP